MQTETKQETLTPPPEFLKLAEVFCLKYKDLPAGTYKSDSGEYVIEYLEHIIDRLSGIALTTNARVSYPGGIVELDKTKLAADEITPEFVFSLILWCWFAYQGHKEENIVVDGYSVVADKRMIDYLKTIRSSVKNALEGWIFFLSNSPSPLNEIRIAAMKELLK